MTQRSPRLRIYLSLRYDCGFTHHQARFLIRTHLSNLGTWDNILYEGLKEEKKIWANPAEIVAALSMRQDPKQSGRSIVQNCWPNRDQDPEAPFVCATEAAKIVKNAMQYNDKDRRILWQQIQCILDHEEKNAIEAWNDRLIHQYLQIKGFLSP